MIGSISQEIRYAPRTFIKDPAFETIAVVTATRVNPIDALRAE